MLFVLIEMLFFLLNRYIFFAEEFIFIKNISTAPSKVFIVYETMKGFNFVSVTIEIIKWRKYW